MPEEIRQSGGTFQAMGIGLTNACNLACAHCYAAGDNDTHLSPEQFVRWLDTVQPGSVNLGTGESCMHPQFDSFVDIIRERGIKASLTSNGSSVLKLSTDQLQVFHDIDISMDFPDQARHDAFRGPGAFRTAVSAVERCLDCGVDVSIVTCMMNVNLEHMPGMRHLIDHYGITWRINVYKPVQTDRFVVDVRAFWQTWERLLAEFAVVAVSEPVLAAFMDPQPEVSAIHCGKASLRVRPTGEAVPCVYWTGDTIPMPSPGTDWRDVRDQFDRLGLDRVPGKCTDCPELAVCHGGCTGRRKLYGMDQPDYYCPLQHEMRPRLSWTRAAAKDLVHAGYLCTVILSTEEG